MSPSSAGGLSRESLLAELPDHTEARDLVLPLLRVDTRLYRHYQYKPEALLDIPIFAYGGGDDPNVRREHLESYVEWRRRRGSRGLHQIEDGWMALSVVGQGCGHLQLPVQLHALILANRAQRNKGRCFAAARPFRHSR